MLGKIEVNLVLLETAQLWNQGFLCPLNRIFSGHLVGLLINIIIIKKIVKFNIIGVIIKTLNGRRFNLHLGQ